MKLYKRSKAERLGWLKMILKRVFRKRHAVLFFKDLSRSEIESYITLYGKIDLLFSESLNHK